MITYDSVPKEIESLIGLIDTYKRWTNFKEKGNRIYKSYHPSEIGKCLRLQQYKHYAELGLIKSSYKEIDSKTLRLFDKGHNMHNRWSNYFDKIGVLRGRWKCKNILCSMFDDDGKIKKNHSFTSLYETKTSRIFGEKEGHVFKPKKCICGCVDFEYLETSVYSEELNLSGHVDVIIDCSNLKDDRFKEVRSTFNEKYLPKKGDIIVGDMKTIGSRAWDFQLKRKGPHPAYLIQILIYTYLLNCKYGVLMYENKDTSEMQWYKVERNKKWWEILKWQLTQMIKMVKNKELPPPRPKIKSDYECKYCSYKNLCHKSGIWKCSDLESKRKNFYNILL